MGKLLFNMRRRPGYTRLHLPRIEVCPRNLDVIPTLLGAFTVCILVYLYSQQASLFAGGSYQVIEIINTTLERNVQSPRLQRRARL